jgi:tetratricopeptide (TPR) repeat protein
MKKLIFIIFGLGLLAGTGRLALSGYRHWRQHRFLSQAADFIARSDAANANLCLSRAIQCDPFDVKALRMYASQVEQAGSRNAIVWRRRVVELEPKVLQNRIDWAKSGLVLGDLAAAKDALESVDEHGRKTSEYHKAAGSLAWGLNDYPAAETHYLEALRLEPDNPATMLNLAMARLVADNGARASWARTSLLSLRTNSAMRLDALRQLMYDALRSGRPDIAASYARELQEDPACRFKDRLEYLNTLRQAQLPQQTSYLPYLKSVAATNSANAYEFVSWMARKGETKEALTWAESLPPVIRTNLPLPLIMAEGYASVAQWPALDSMLKNQDWKDMEYLRHLLMSRSCRMQGNTHLSTVEWRSALKIASRRIDSLNDLIRRTSAWHWNTELDETLWAIVENFPIEKGAFLALYDRLIEEGNTAALHNLLAKISSFVPLTPELKNNFALVSLLMYPKGQHGHLLAREAYNNSPNDPFVVSTYAYSLHLQGKTIEALGLLNKLNQDQLENPAIAAYYGVILAGSGAPGKAKHFLERGLEAKLLPEEKTLLTKAGEKM